MARRATSAARSAAWIARIVRAQPGAPLVNQREHFAPEKDEAPPFALHPHHHLGRHRIAVPGAEVVGQVPG
jgi:hypothetical protein